MEVEEILAQHTDKISLNFSTVEQRLFRSMVGSIQYASATGTGAFGSSATQITELPNVTLAPGQYYLVQEAQGSGGTTNLTSPDLIDATPIAMSGTGAKVALVNMAVSLGCNGGSIPCIASQLAQIVDLVGWDGANFYETSPAPATTNLTAVLRNSNGCTETDNNFSDFIAGAPAPRNTSSPLNPCVVGDAAPTVSNTVPSNGATNIARATDISITFSENVNINPASITISCATSGVHTFSFIGGPTTFTLNPDVDFAANETCTVTVLASGVTDRSG